jgi:hypothetical protein
MTFSDLETAARDQHPLPDDEQPLVRALWHDATGDWARAHELAQGVESAEGAWVHAYLHRKEGDLDNAAYWYRRAGRSVAAGDLHHEWVVIARALLRES